MNSIDNSHLLQAENWLIKSSQAVLSHWDDESKTFLRNSESSKDRFYTSASMHSIIALENIGFWPNNNSKTPKIETPYFEILSNNSPSSEELIESFIALNKKDNNHWVNNILQNSSHVGKKSLTKPRTAIVLELILNAWASLTADSESTKEKYKEQTKELVEVSKKLIRSYLTQFKCKPGETPAPISNFANCIITINALDNTNEFGKELVLLREMFEDHVNYHMARSGIKSIMSFDPVSLAIALSGVTKIKTEPIDDLFFQSCLEVIMKAQHENGCWDDGISITYSSTGDVVQQPSVGVAVAIAEAAILPEFLYDYDENIGKVLQIVIPGLRKTAQFLQETYQIINQNSKLIYGWSSDRTRTKNYTEVWITALANRFFFRLWIAEKALLRHKSLKSLGIKNFKSRQNILKDRNLWNKEVIEPDNYLNPTSVIWDKFITPILKQQEKNYIISKPDKNNVSFIIYGPPGSGKTFFIEKIAKFLDWPLVEINPGHFIKNGLELIEATTRELFDMLNSLNHAVVFFDECDELFRNRDSNSSTARSILSFATASMLPKLQKLHDSRNVIFVLGTNYLSNMDSAIIRPGRFDEIIFFDRPDAEGRRVFIKEVLKIDDEKEINSLISNTNLFTFQEIIAFNKNQTGFQSSVTDYRKWAIETGVEELEASRLTRAQQLEVQKKWNQN